MPPFAASNPQTTACAESPNHDCYQFTVTGLPPITGGYSFGITAVNDANSSVRPPATRRRRRRARRPTQGMPSNPRIPARRSRHARRRRRRVTGIQYVIPSGNGGVFGAQGNFTFSGTNTTFCGGSPCIGGSGNPNTAAGAVNLGSFFGYDFRHPILEIITWDFSTFTPVRKRPRPRSWCTTRRPGPASPTSCQSARTRATRSHRHRPREIRSPDPPASRR